MCTLFVYCVLHFTTQYHSLRALEHTLHDAQTHFHTLTHAHDTLKSRRHCLPTHMRIKGKAPSRVIWPVESKCKLWNANITETSLIASRYINILCMFTCCSSMENCLRTKHALKVSSSINEMLAPFHFSCVFFFFIFLYSLHQQQRSNRLFYMLLFNCLAVLVWLTHTFDEREISRVNVCACFIFDSLYPLRLASDACVVVRLSVRVVRVGCE